MMMIKKGSITSCIVVTMLSFLSVTVNAINPDFYCARDCAASGACSNYGGVYTGYCFSDNTCQCYCKNDVQQFMRPAGTTCEEGGGTAACTTACNAKAGARNAWCSDVTNTYTCTCNSNEEVTTAKACEPDIGQVQCTKSCTAHCATTYKQQKLQYTECAYNGGDNRCLCWCAATGSNRDGDLLANQYCGQDSDGLEPPVEGFLAASKDLWEQTVGPLVCFSSETTVVVEVDTATATDTAPSQSSNIRRISDIVAGDRVLTKNGQYETVYAIDHKEKHRPTKFIQIHHEQQKQSLEITKNHMVFLMTKTNEMVAKAAEMVKVGDKLHTISGPSTVTKISTVLRNGLFNPLTVSGSIVVNQGVVASTFSSYMLQNGKRTQQSTMEKLLKPYQVACTSVGISLNWCQATGNLSEEKTVVSRWAANLYELWLNQNETIRTVSFSLVMTMTNIFHILFSYKFTLVFCFLVLMTRKIAIEK